MPSTPTIIAAFAFAMVPIGALIFWPAGTFNWPAGWFYVALVFSTVVATAAGFLLGIHSGTCIGDRNRCSDCPGGYDTDSRTIRLCGLRAEGTFPAGARRLVNQGTRLCRAHTAMGLVATHWETCISTSKGLMFNDLLLILGGENATVTQFHRRARHFNYRR